MKISIIVIFYDMEREAPRTLRSLACGYQAQVTEQDYEVIAIDNGSPKPLKKRLVESFGKNFRYHYVEDAHPSPVSAINLGVEMAEGDIVGIMIDGARIATPGILWHTKAAFRAFDNPVVATLGWHIGPEAQQLSIKKGYSKKREDELLERINFPYAGYKLFSIAALGGSSRRGCFFAPAESNCVFVKKDIYNAMGGFDTRFDIPGGGLANLDFFRRACLHEDAQLIVLPGEGTFHQFHGGATTNAAVEEQEGKYKLYLQQYKEIRGEDFEPVEIEPIVFGKVPRPAIDYVRNSANYECEINKVISLYFD